MHQDEIRGCGSVDPGQLKVSQDAISAFQAMFRIIRAAAGSPTRYSARTAGQSVACCKEGGVKTFLLVLAALFPVVNPPGSGLIFLGMTRGASSATRRWLARRVAVNAFFIMAMSLPIGGVILRFYGISIPILRVAGGLVVAATGWRLLNEGSPKGSDAIAPTG